MASTPDPALAELSFEDALKRLEAIVARLESGDATLDDAIKLYQEGDRLRAQCEQRLTDAQMRIERISTDAAGKPTGTHPFDGE